MRTVISGPLAGTAAGAVAEQALRSCVHCGMCNATCPTYQLTGDELDGPRGRIYLLKQALAGEPVSALTLKHLDRCLSCRACETTCPSGVQYHRLYDVGRKLVVEKVGRPWPERVKRAVIGRLTAPPAFGIALALGRAFRFALPTSLRAKVPPRVAFTPFRPGAHDRAMVMLKGCVQAAAAGHFNAATARVFDKVGIALTETPGSGCCGAVDFHLDAQGAGQAAARRNIDAWWPRIEAGAEAIVANSSGCAAFIRDYPDVLRDDPAYAEKAQVVAGLVRDPIQVLETSPPVAVRAPNAARIAVHEPCTLQHGPKLGGGRIGRLLASLGYEPQPVAEAHLCCGSAGAYSLLQPELSQSLRMAKLAALTASAPAAIYTANIGCWMHLADESGPPVRHWIEAVDDVTRIGAGA